MSEYYKELRKLLKNQLENLKCQGLKVYMNKSTDYCFGIISDGNDIVYIQRELGLMFSLSFQYHPTHEWGSGVSLFPAYMGKRTINKEDYFNCVEYGRRYALARGIRLYKDLDEYMKDPWNRRNYIEV